MANIGDRPDNDSKPEKKRGESTTFFAKVNDRKATKESIKSCIIAFDQLFRLRPVGGGDIAFSNALLFPRWLPVATECLGHGNSGYKMRWRAPLFDCKPPPSAIHFISQPCHATTALLSTPTSEPSPSWKAVPRVTVCSV